MQLFKEKVDDLQFKCLELYHCQGVKSVTASWQVLYFV